MIKQTVGALLTEKVTLDSEGIDRVYLNPYQPMLETGAGAATFFKQHHGAKMASICQGHVFGKISPRSP